VRWRRVAPQQQRALAERAHLRLLHRLRHHIAHHLELDPLGIVRVDEVAVAAQRRAALLARAVGSQMFARQLIAHLQVSPLVLIK
jgi:hypothetical protein